MTALCQVECSPFNSIQLDVFYRTHWSAVVRRCQRILGDENDAMDLAQEVFVRVMDKAQDFRHEAQWSTWLYRIATNLCLNELRNTSRRAEILRDEDAVELLGLCACPPSAETVYEAREAVDYLRAIFDGRTMTMIVHYHVEEASQGEIAAELETSRVTVNKRLSMFKQVAQRFMSLSSESADAGLSETRSAA